jgi:glycosyltransferase involved in cell wall biosynthesis
LRSICWSCTEQDDSSRLRYFSEYRKEPVRILNVIDLMNPASGGGATERSCQMSKYLALAGEDVDILTTTWDMDARYVAGLTGVGCHPVKALYCRYLLPLGVGKWLEENLGNYDLVHLSKNWSLLAHFTGMAAARRNIPFVFSSMGFVAIHNRSRMLKRVYRKHLTIPLIRKASACISVTREEVADLINAGADPKKVCLIPNGIVPEDFVYEDSDGFRRRHNLGERKIILFVGRMDPIKGVHLIIEAFERRRPVLNDWLLLLVGTKTAYREEMEQKVKALDLQQSVVFLDPIFGKEKSEAYHAAEFVAVPSVKDAMTIIAPEAACCAKPVLITTSSDFAELAQAGGAVEVPPSVDGLSSGLDYMTGANCDRSGMGQKGQDYVLNKFKWEKIALEYKRLFRDILGSAYT